MDDDLCRRQRGGGAEQRGDAGRLQLQLVVVVEQVHVEERRRGAGNQGERGVERAGRDVVERERGEVSPEPAPPAREQARVRGGAGAADAGEDLEEDVVGEGADAVLLAVREDETEAGGVWEKAPAAAFHIQLVFAAEGARDLSIGGQTAVRRRQVNRAWG